jgi:Pyruvate/2-oxoacid:ferredoxin oxidoreductase gamma subunit
MQTPKSKPLEILIIGTDGQQIETLSKIIAEAAFSEGLKGSIVHTSYTPGVCGGAVVPSVIIAEAPQIYSLVQQADYAFISAAEPPETKFLSRRRKVFITSELNTSRVSAGMKLMLAAGETPSVAKRSKKIPRA